MGDSCPCLGRTCLSLRGTYLYLVETCLSLGGTYLRLTSHYVRLGSGALQRLDWAKTPTDLTWARASLRCM